MRNKSTKIISVLALSFMSALQAQHVVVVADSRGVSVEAQVSYEDEHRFPDAEVKPVFRVYEHGSETTFVDVPTAVDPLQSTLTVKKVKGRVPERIENVGVVELVSFRQK